MTTQSYAKSETADRQSELASLLDRLTKATLEYGGLVDTANKIGHRLIDTNEEKDLAAKEVAMPGHGLIVELKKNIDAIEKSNAKFYKLLDKLNGLI